MRDMLDLGCRGAKAALSAAALEELRRRCALVASDVDLGPAGRGAAHETKTELERR